MGYRIPPYPRSASPEARQILLRQAAAELVASAEQDVGATMPADQMQRALRDAERAVSSAWLVERVEALEAEARKREEAP